MELILATRKSMLAQTQTDTVMKLLKEKVNVNSKKLLVVTEGDKRLDVTLDKIGGKGLFTKDIEIALLERRAHAAVHSMKDVPYEMGEEFELVAMPEREDVRDVLVTRDGITLNELRKGAIIGTSSIRRAAQLKALRSDLNIVPIRGNVGTRLEKMKKEGMDGIILAAAGLKRLGMEDIISDYLDPEIFVPAVSQGALGIECLKNCEYKSYLKELDNSDVRIAVEAERSFMRELNGGCHSLIGAYAKLQGKDLYIIGTYEVNGNIVKKDILGNKEDNIELGIRLARKIIG
ncbi:hydroxymethylbilane synthase [Clostridium celatum]|uniref:Porphobilinogen deaminase n=1 Tax=Clostridium celatum DSM 1785 TaxID=545697 RepID=L1Q6K4_9CLOT|nr:hydroxymethylbilane synthase [Clostridium celatum]EKY23237.1 hydroxymethylbilane synthase [Clostridium celatum DSM 1785]MCE9656013.1 hydroxymethylbilane synthase [Clostridium celatum]MDU2264909.1 hydroxymethylbilane synthase [Clostridium celatum]MDU3723612.1 hydroxymethylbilane synthase [Clostridium celatum]MDU6294503.1 hydroxymethylbilane synthase [Clostridium celatum]